MAGETREHRPVITNPLSAEEMDKLNKDVDLAKQTTKNSRNSLEGTDAVSAQPLLQKND